MYAQTVIPTSQLTEGDLPPVGSNWAAYAAFAAKFDPSESYRSVEACGEVASWAFSRWQANGQVPIKLDALRACLYFELRRWRFLGQDPNPEAMRWINALIAEMRLLLR
jgi:hypothetical protein